MGGVGGGYWNKGGGGKVSEVGDGGGRRLSIKRGTNDEDFLRSGGGVIIGGGLVTSVGFVLWIYYVRHMDVLVENLGTW